MTALVTTAVPATPLTTSPVAPIAWASAYEQLAAYAAQHGNSSPPQQYRTPDGYWLGKWVQNQRQVYRKDSRRSLAPDRAARLQALPGWTWHKAPSDREPRRPNSHPRAPRKFTAAPLTPPAGRISGIVGKAGLAAWLRASTRDVSLNLPVHPVHGSLRQTVLGLQASYDKLTLQETAALSKVPGWAWKNNPGGHIEWMRTYDQLRAATARGSLSGLSVGLFTDRGVNLRDWLVNQQDLYLVGRLRVDEQRALEALRGWDVYVRQTHRRPAA